MAKKSAPEPAHVWFRVFIIVAAAVLVYAPSLCGGMLWDDDMLIVENPALRSADGLWGIWTALPAVDYWPLTWTLLWVEWHLWGGNLLGYHIVSLALHIASGLLLWCVLDRLGLRRAWIGGLLFVIHPLAVESVAWASEIKNTFSLPLYLLAFLFWLRAGKSRTALVASLACYLAAMLAKTSVVMLPAVFLLHAWWRDGRITGKTVLRLAPFALVAFVLSVITIEIQATSPGIKEASAPSLFALVCLAASNVFFYLDKFIWPIPLLPVYPNTSFDPPGALQIASVPLLLAIFILLGIRASGWRRHVLFGFGFFVLNLLPVLGFLRMTYFSTSHVADHLVYLPMIGLVGLAALGFQSLYDLRSGPARVASVSAFVALASFWIVLAHTYADQFTSRETLWRYTLARNPDAVPALADIGLMVLQQGRVEEALMLANRAIQLNPDSPSPHLTRGIIEMSRGELPAALVDLQSFRRLSPGDKNAGYAALYIWIIQQKQGRADEAERDLAAALAQGWSAPPGTWAVNHAQFLLGRIDEATYLAFLPDNPDRQCEARFYAGEKRLLAGDKAAAMEDFQACVATGKTDFYEYILARGELASLSAR